MYSRELIDDACRIVHAQMPPTPQYAWPLLQQRLGMEVWVKHENHNPVGAFKMRGGLVYVDCPGTMNGVPEGRDQQPSRTPPRCRPCTGTQARPVSRC